MPHRTSRLRRILIRTWLPALIAFAAGTITLPPFAIAESDPADLPATESENSAEVWAFEEDLRRPGRSFPADRVHVEIMEEVPVARTWEFDMRQPRPLFDTAYFAMKNLPRQYNGKGQIADREIPILLHFSSRVELPAGEYEFLLRSLDAARLYVDGKLVGQTDFMSLRSDAHQKYYEGLDRGPDILSLAEGHQEERFTVTLEGSSHEVSLYRLLGNKKHGSYLGELIVAVAPVGGEFQILSPTEYLPYTDGGWLGFLDWERGRLTDVNARHRREQAASQADYWSRRHELARSLAGPPVELPEVAEDQSIHNSIDRFINARLDAADIAPRPVVDDLAFLRRVTLDTIGVIPTEEQIASFLNLPADTRRQQMIDQLLNEPGWADHWVGYWQDVLAENPGLTKPELNNTGLFRWFLHESFLDNKPFDRFVTELIMMEGSRYWGGPAGFGVASQNDVPMAAKAHILGTAFLGVEMKCARCHDAPFRDLTQQDLFSLAAMLNRKPLKVPGTSSVPGSAEELANLVVEVSLQPGTSVSPEWPFAELTDATHSANETEAPSDEADLFDNFLRDSNDSREQLALLVTSPTNERFAQVIVNRVWTRYLGRGIVEPVNDWEGADPSHPELLAYLVRELTTHDYDLKHIARLILNSHTYQRSTLVGDDDTEATLFAGPTRRRMTAEQIVDSLLLAVGKDLGAEELTMDKDGKRPDSTFGHLGIPRRAWEMVAVSNERDRPSLNLPIAQSVIDTLAAYGWRQQRQEPLTEREEQLTPLQPMALAHGTTANRIVDLSDHAATTSLCLDDQPLENFIERLFQRFLTRPPTPEEKQLFADILRDDYETRIVAGVEAVPPRRIYRSGIAWTNHFDPKSDEEAIRRQREILHGDKPTARLDADWRQRTEDVIWTLINTPEFVFVP